MAVFVKHQWVSGEWGSGDMPARGWGPALSKHATTPCADVCMDISALDMCSFFGAAAAPRVCGSHSRASPQTESESESESES